MSKVGIAVNIDRSLIFALSETCLDVDNQMVLPLWPPKAESMIVEDGVYELRAVLTTSISFVTSCTIKVWTSAIRTSLILICFLPGRCWWDRGTASHTDDVGWYKEPIRHFARLVDVPKGYSRGGLEQNTPVGFPRNSSAKGYDCTTEF